MSNVRSLPTPAARISSRLRTAIKLRVHEGRTIADACQMAGIAQSTWFKAMGRPAIRDHLAQVQADFVAQADGLRESLRARALEVAAALMESAKSENVRADMVKFILSEGKAAPTVSVHVDARPQGGGDYAFVPPGSRVVGVTPEDSTGTDD